MRIRPYLLVLLSVFCALILAGCSGWQGFSVPDPSITVEGSLVGDDGAYTPVDPVTLSVTHDPDSLTPRIDARLHGMQDLKSITLGVSASQGLPFDGEEFAFLSLSRSTARVGDDTPVIVELTGDGLWVKRHRGDLAVLRLRKDDVSLPTADFDAFSAAPMRPAGAAWLARIEADDRRLPWTVAPGEDGCTAIPLRATLVAPAPGETTDCFDLHTFSGMFFANLAATVVEALDTANLPVPVTTGQHRLYLVPHMKLEGENGSFPGFGWLYEVELSVNVGLTLAKVRATVPVSVHFIPVNEPGMTLWRLDVLIDPLGPAPVTAPWANIDRVTVEYEDGLLNGALAGEVRTALVNALSSLIIPPFDVAGTTLTLEAALSLLVSLTMPRSSIVAPYPDDFDVVALPEQRVTISSAIRNEVLAYGSVTTTVSTGNQPGAATTDLTGTTIVTANGGLVTRTTMLDPLGVNRRVTTLFPVSMGTPFELYLME